MDLIGFVKDNFLLCICTLGFAIVGYLGCHLVKWIREKCEKTEKIDSLARDVLQNVAEASNSPSLTSRVTQLSPTEGTIQSGHGEYLVFKKDAEGNRFEVSEETFKKVYPILTEFSPQQMIRKDYSSEQISNRHTLIQNRLQEIDPDVKILFVPRTLWDLTFIKESIEEDLQRGSICDYQDLTTHRNHPEIPPNCWHVTIFRKIGDSHHVAIQNIAYRLNQIILKTLPQKEGYTAQEFIALAQEKITYLKDYKITYEANFKKHQNDPSKHKEPLIDYNYAGPTSNFATELYRGSVKPMGIRNDEDAALVERAIELECHAIAKESFILYRGAEFEKDLPCRAKDPSQAHSLSFGTGLFAGCMFDPGATAFHFMREKADAYAIPIPFEKARSGPFYIPPDNTFAQLFGEGETFHARTKVWHQYKGFIQGFQSKRIDLIETNFTKEELISQFLALKQNAIFLKKNLNPL
jgi:hypothetical protein